ncbi:heavy-metal-associated domain-containing protein [Streptoalloteichus hindustanus]|uniref:Copper chaperone CopZ n=1 Tax=Streptoalloteichus hindustanus TaxID=2017 RepID=A0A1M5ENB7_STRHI|nr:heavy-metal-associated domain-containing protein [Streptoalloteichus hindustanus]SHF80705.1 Copper chaperone CopZ [Streptoalloteichus hindustanus]
MPSTHTFMITDMRCGSCALLIDDVLEDLPGVTDPRTSARRGRTTLLLDTTRTTPEQVIAAIASAGYTAHLLP